MSNFLNKNKFKNKFFRVATKALIFSFFCFLILNIGFNNNIRFPVFTHAVEKGSYLDNYLKNQDIVNSDGLMAEDLNYDVDRGGGGIIGWALKMLLELASLLVSGAVKLFSIVINPSLFDKMFVENGTILYEMWGFIRDFLNIFFILILLFSAFATVFQVSKYHITKIILMVVLMALLVNFSWPVTRVIIDLSNVTMYFFVEEMLGDSSGTGTTAQLGALSGLSDILIDKSFAKNVDKSNTYLLLAVITVFVFGMTLLAYAGVLLIRVIALTLLLIFSPVGFLAAAFPSTSKYASQWWDNLFKYAFSGPILIFMLIVAIKMMEAIGNSDLGEKGILETLKEGGITGFMNDMGATIAFFVIPIVILWTALITAGKAGDSFSAGVSSKVQGWSKGTGKWARKWSGKGVMATGRGVDSITGNYGAKTIGKFKGIGQRGSNILEGMEKKRTRLVDQSTAEFVSRDMGIIGGRDRGAVTRQDNKETREKEAKLKAEQTDMTTALTELETATGNDAQALRNYISSQKEAITSVDDLDKAITHFGDNAKDIEKLLDNISDKAFKEMDSTSYASLRNKVEVAAGVSNSDAEKLLNKKMFDTGGADKVLNGGGLDINMFKNMQADVLAKQGKLFEDIISGGGGGQYGSDLNDVKIALADKMSRAPSFELKFKEKAGRDTLKNAENAIITGLNP